MRPIFKEKDPIILIFSIPGWFAVSINPVKWSYTALFFSLSLSWLYNPHWGLYFTAL
jgi:hypothetical protein